LAVLAIFVSGCATHAPYFKLDSSLQKDIRTFAGGSYVPLERLCGVYGVECRWDSFIKTATLKKLSNNIVLRADSDVILFNGNLEKLERPVVFYGGTVFVPVSFARSYLGAITARAPAERLQKVVSPKKFTIKTVIIDPGHGGKDVGAVGRRIHVREKEKALYLARKLRSILEDSGIRAIMTRDDDRFIPLPRRAEIANNANADLFVSVHLNASRSTSMRGFECYFLSNATDDNARALEAFEDSSLKLGDTASAEHSSRLDKTLWDMALTENRLESAQLANYICESVERNVTIANRGIRSARFYVLKHTHMPSVLVEAGYLSNKYEEMKLKDPAFLDRIAQSVAEGVLKYKREYENTEGFTKS